MCLTRVNEEDFCSLAPRNGYKILAMELEHFRDHPWSNVKLTTPVIKTEIKGGWISDKNYLWESQKHLKASNGQLYRSGFHILPVYNEAVHYAEQLRFKQQMSVILPVVGRDIVASGYEATSLDVVEEFVARELFIDPRYIESAKRKFRELQKDWNFVRGDFFAMKGNDGVFQTYTKGYQPYAFCR